MNWTLGFILALGVVLPIGVGLGLGAYAAIQSPVVLAGTSALLLKEMIPILIQYAGKPNSPEVQARIHDVIRRAGEWDNFNKRER